MLQLTHLIPMCSDIWMSGCLRPSLCINAECTQSVEAEKDAGAKFFEVWRRVTIASTALAALGFIAGREKERTQEAALAEHRSA